ncbi:putative endonuclease-reverse transcriptase [Trichonephila clavipes]|nr:putative endonuclease-reverse transcriptase [Trichonephila clavipes]
MCEVYGSNTMNHAEVCNRVRSSKDMCDNIHEQSSIIMDDSERAIEAKIQEPSLHDCSFVNDTSIFQSQCFTKSCHRGCLLVLLDWLCISFEFRTTAINDESRRFEQRSRDVDYIYGETDTRSPKLHVAAVIEWYSFLKLRAKLFLNKSLIRSVLTYASEIWRLTLHDEEALGIFERTILRCILGETQVNGLWRRRSNLKLYKIYKQPDIVKFVKLQRLKWVGHLARMNEDRCCKRIFLTKPMGNKPRGKPPLRWIDCVEKDLNILMVKNWKTVAKSRDARRKLLEKAKAHPALSSH